MESKITTTAIKKHLDKIRERAAYMADHNLEYDECKDIQAEIEVAVSAIEERLYG